MVACRGAVEPSVGSGQSQSRCYCGGTEHCDVEDRADTLGDHSQEPNMRAACVLGIVLTRSLSLAENPIMTDCRNVHLRTEQQILAVNQSSPLSVALLQFSKHCAALKKFLEA